MTYYEKLQNKVSDVRDDSSEIALSSSTEDLENYLEEKGEALPSQDSKDGSDDGSSEPKESDQNDEAKDNDKESDDSKSKSKKKTPEFEGAVDVVMVDETGDNDPKYVRTYDEERHGDHPKYDGFLDAAKSFIEANEVPDTSPYDKFELVKHDDSRPAPEIR